MKDQKKLWDELHIKGNVRKHSGSETTFAVEVSKIISPRSKILELGCGVGNDSIYFASTGHSIIATDFSEVVIKENTERFKNTANLIFQVFDMTKLPYRFQDREFDVVYARLSLHYFTDNLTRQIVKEIYRVLKHGGYFCFMCKSTADPLYGKGEEIEKGMFENDGHVRHFFSEEYSRDILKDNFEIIKIESGEEDLYGKSSAFVKVIAKKLL